MSHFLSRLVQRTLGDVAVVRPVAHAVTGPDPAAVAWDEQVTARDAPTLVTPRRAAPVPAAPERTANAPSTGRPLDPMPDRAVDPSGAPRLEATRLVASARPAAMVAADSAGEPAPALPSDRVVAPRSDASRLVGSPTASVGADGPLGEPEPIMSAVRAVRPSVDPLGARDPAMPSDRAVSPAVATRFEASRLVVDPTSTSISVADLRGETDPAMPSDRAVSPAVVLRVDRLAAIEVPADAPHDAAPSTMAGEPAARGRQVRRDEVAIAATPTPGLLVPADPARSGATRAASMTPRGPRDRDPGRLAQETTTVEVSIGRIEVRLPPARVPRPAEPTPPRRPAVDLDEYLRRRDSGSAR